MTLPDSNRSGGQHPVVEPWQTLKGFLAWGVAANAERPPEAPLSEHLAARRQLASEVVKAAHAVIDAIDKHQERARRCGP